jgi:Domain of unknown function (DUF5615)
MKSVAWLYTDEDMSALVTTLLRSQGFDVATVPEQATLGRTDREQLAFATSLGRCIVTHNRVDCERLHRQYLEEDGRHSGIVIVPQKNAYEVAQRIGNLVNALTADEMTNQLLYA